MEKKNTGRAVIALLFGLIVFVFVSCIVLKLGMPETVWQLLASFGMSWLIASLFSLGAMEIVMLPHIKWPRWFEIARVMLGFPLMVIDEILDVPSRLHFYWTLHCRMKLACEVDKDFVILWPRVEHYRSKGANSHLDKLRVLVEDKSTPPKARLRIKKLLRIMEPLRPESAEAFAAAGSKQTSQTA